VPWRARGSVLASDDVTVGAVSGGAGVTDGNELLPDRDREDRVIRLVRAHHEEAAPTAADRGVEMATRARRDRLEVHRDLPPRVVPGSSTVAPAATEPSSPAELTPVPDTPSADTGVGRTEPATDVSGHLAGTATAADPDQWVDPEMYGVRTSWQSEAVRIEAAEFLVATRVQESSRRRLARLTQRLREQARAERHGA
jgi:hypothetical protein